MPKEDSCAGYHAVWYQNYKPSTCKYGFHTHVGYALSLDVCKRALCIQLVTTIKELGGNPTKPCPQPPKPPSSDL